MPALVDISFVCPSCSGPLIVERQFAGSEFACPHCAKPAVVPEQSPINKDHFLEPRGLRRIMKEIRDREWEEMRRRLHTCRAELAALKAQAAEAKSVPVESARRARVMPASEGTEAAKERPATEGSEVDRLRAHIADLNVKLAQANQAFAAATKQQDGVVRKLRRELEANRQTIAQLQAGELIQAATEDLPVAS